MTMEYLEGEFRRLGDEDLAREISNIRKRYAERHKQEDVHPLSVEKMLRESLFPKPFTTEADLLVEYFSQCRKYIDLGFHRALGMTEEEYVESMPKFEFQTDPFKGRFDIPVLVETRIPLKQTANLAYLDYYLNDMEVADWMDDPERYRSPNIPYTTWMQDGKKYLGKSVRDVRANLAPDERGATVYDGIALFVLNPGLLHDKTHYIDLPGTSVGIGHAPNFQIWNSTPEIHHRHIVRASGNFGSVTCGR